MKKILILLLMLSCVYAATITSSSYPTNPVKHDNIVTFSFEYTSNVTNASKLVFNGNEYTSDSCGTTSCIFFKQVSIPDDIVGGNYSWQFWIGPELMVEEQLPVMDLQLLFSSHFTSLRDYMVHGNFSWADGTPLNGKTVMIKFIDDDLLSTDSNGRFERSFTFEEDDVSSSYPGNITAVFGDFSKQVHFEAEYYGVPVPTLSFDKELLVAGDVSVTQNDVVELIVTWETEINPVNKTEIFFNAFGADYSEDCEEQVSVCERQFNINIPAGTEGTHEIVIESESENSDGTKTFVNKSINIIVESHDWYTIDSSPITLDVYAGESHQFEISAVKHGNVVSNISINVLGERSEWVSPSERKVSLTADRQLNFGVNIPYEANKGNYGMTIQIIGREQDYEIPLTLVVKAPNLVWSPSSAQRRVATEQKIDFVSTITNDGQAASRDIVLEPICPLDWICTLSLTEKESLEVGESIEVNLTATIKHVESVIEPRIGIKATDQVGRRADAMLTLDVVSEVVELAQEKTFFGNIVGEEYTDRYFFISEDEYFNKPELNYNGTKARIRRTSPLSTWSVKVLGDSRGLGSVCDVFVVTSNNSYELDPNGIERTLVGNVGDYAWEAIKLKSEGECYVHLQYNNEDTITYLTMSRPPQDQVSDVDKVSAMITAAKLEAEERDRYALFALIGILLFINSRTKRGKKPPHTIGTKKKKMTVDYSIFDKTPGMAPGVAPKTQSPFERFIDRRVKPAWNNFWSKAEKGDPETIESLKSDAAAKFFEKTTRYVPKAKREQYKEEQSLFDDMLGPKGGKGDGNRN